MGILTLGQLAQHPLEQLKKRFGIMGEQLYWHAWGIDLSPIYTEAEKEEQKGFSHGITLLRDYSEEETYVCMLDLCEEVARRTRASKKAGRTIHLSIGYANNLGGFHRSRSLDLPTNVTMDIYHVCLQLFHEFYDHHSKIRRVTVSLNNLYDDIETQLQLFEDKGKKKDIGYVMDTIRDQHGSTAILRATSYTDAGITIERSKKNRWSLCLTISLLYPFLQLVALQFIGSITRKNISKKNICFGILNRASRLRQCFTISS